MAEVIVIGGGLAGLATAAALGGAGHRVRLLEARRFLGGRATSYEIPAGAQTAGSPTIDNCQHVLLRCCLNLRDFYRRLGVEDDIHFHRQFFFLEPGGRKSVLKAGWLPRPAHFAGSFLRLGFLTLGEKLAVMRGIRAIGRQRHRDDLDRITMLDWLHEERQPPRAIQRFWAQVLVSAINEDLDRMAASYGFLVFRLGFLARRDSYEMGIPAVPLTHLYRADAWARVGNVEILSPAPVQQVLIEAGRVRGVVTGPGTLAADYYVSALPFERIGAVIPGLGLDVSEFSHSPITGIHLWFDRPITDLAHAALLDRTIQWMFNKGEGRHIQLVVSASRGLVPMARAGVIELALRELAEYFPKVRQAKLENAHVVKELRATFSARPGLEPHRPPAQTSIGNLFLAGDWTRCGWPATMEGAVRSGYLAAEAVAKAAGQAQGFLLPDLD